MSSANNVGSEVVLLWISLICNKNKSNPSVDPCSTLCAICSVVDVILLTVTYCFLSARYELNRSCA